MFPSSEHWSLDQEAFQLSLPREQQSGTKSRGKNAGVSSDSDVPVGGIRVGGAGEEAGDRLMQGHKQFFAFLANELLLQGDESAHDRLEALNLELKDIFTNVIRTRKREETDTEEQVRGGGAGAQARNIVAQTHYIVDLEADAQQHENQQQPHPQEVV